MDKIVEAMARAMWAVHYPHKPWENRTSVGCQPFLDFATAALAVAGPMIVGQIEREMEEWRDGASKALQDTGHGYEALKAYANALGAIRNLKEQFNGNG